MLRKRSSALKRKPPRQTFQEFYIPKNKELQAKRDKLLRHKIILINSELRAARPIIAEAIYGPAADANLNTII